MTRYAVPDSGGEGPAYKLPETPFPEPVLPGIRMWQTEEGWTVLRLHYSADPERADSEWIKEQAEGYRGGTDGRDWQREMEIDFSSYSGEPVYAGFNPHSVQPCKYDPELPLWRGWDFGYRHPAVVFLQYDPQYDRLHYLHEIYPTLNREEMPGIKTDDLARLVLQVTDELFPGLGEGAGIMDFCDPSGTQHKEGSDFSAIETLGQHGIQAEWNVVGRKNRINYARYYVEGGPEHFRINPHCTLGIKAFSKAYRYPEEKVGGTDREMPDLSKRVQEEPYIHLMDAFEYVAANTLQIDYQMHTSRSRKQEPDTPRIGSLAEMYLGVAELKDLDDAREERRDIYDRVGQTHPEDDYEFYLADLVSEDDVTDAWLVI